ncbi:MAG: pyruvate dehydrogenase (acetyl-transferring), homodimeric type [Myxococcales bacterium]|nr:pyruvate dehydrogenase (acetyl-transferring), homodimeric type [Myxococcales bacterium]
MSSEGREGIGVSEEADWLLERGEWLEALAAVKEVHGARRVRELLRALQDQALNAGITLEEATLNTPYRNTIAVEEQPAYPGNVELEQRIENIVRWNAMATVLQASDTESGVGGHIATYASAATMLEVGFNHFFRNRSEGYGGDIVNIQPHAAPGVYARGLLEGRFTVDQVRHFRRELAPGGGLSSYPHPMRMPDFWPCPTASMGLSTPISVYLARFARYLENRGLKKADGGKIWCFIGDGEADEPEVLGTIAIAARERLDNLVLVVNCNLQRLDGPVRGNGKVIQELERIFRGAQWNVIKVIWGSAWDALFARDVNGVLQRRMDQAVDGDYQMYSVLPGDRVREHWVRDSEELAELMKTLSDEEIRTIKRGGHDHLKLFAAYQKAIASQGRPTVLLVKTIKGYGMGSGGEGRNIAHQKKKMNDEERLECARRFGIPLSEEAVRRADFYLPPEDSDEVRYLRARREALGGLQPVRKVRCRALEPPPREVFEPFLVGSERGMSTTMALTRMISRLTRDPELGSYVVPIVADEARTFGMEGLFRQLGIYSPEGQRYRPVDADSVSPYKESEAGVILQEGICETGAIASFLAAGTAYAHFGVPTIPFYIFYSMFGFQRVGDMIWAAADSMCRGFLVGGTAGRTTLSGEGPQHQDGHSHVVANTVPSLVSYDPAFAYELAVIVRDGIRRMYRDGENIFYYLTVYNENTPQPAMEAGIEEQILKGIYRFRSGLEKFPGQRVPVHLFGSGALMQQTLRAQERLAELGVGSDVWSVTSYAELYRDCVACERRRRTEPNATAVPYLARALEGEAGVFVAVSDYMKVLPQSLSQWVPGELISLGTDGFGLSGTREELRDYFEVSADYIVFAALSALEAEKAVETHLVEAARQALGAARLP